MITQKKGGVFLGRARITRKSSNGGARHVTADIAGLKNNLVWAPWGGTLQNPFPGFAKLYEGDMCYIEYDDKCENPKLYCMKVYEAAEASSAETVTLVRDGFHHKIFVGDVIMVAPTTFGGKGAVSTVTAVTPKKDSDGNDVWELTVDTALTIAKGDILVEGVKYTEADGSGNTGEWIIKDINGFCPCDMDFVYEPVADPTDLDDFDNAEYGFTPTAGFCGYIHRMGPLPACVKALNTCKWNGIFYYTAVPI